MANKNLLAAKNAKQDEFYTQYADIQKEINAYLERDENAFRGKTVLLPCDDSEWSNFTRFFAQNFEMLGLKKLISTGYAIDSKRKKYGDLFGYAQEKGAVDNDAKAHGKIFVLDHDTNHSGRVAEGFSHHRQHERHHLQRGVPADQGEQVVARGRYS